MTVRIRMKRLGRAHRPYFRICAMDKRTPRDGRVLEELGVYDPSVADTDARAVLKKDRIDYWLSVGAQPSEKVAVLIKKYGANGTHVDQQTAALEKLAQPKAIPPAGPAASKPKQPEAASAEEPAAAATDSAAADSGADTAGTAAKEAPTAEDKPTEETSAVEKPAEATTAEEAPAGETSAGETSAGETSAEETPAEETKVES